MINQIIIIVSILFFLAIGLIIKKQKTNSIGEFTINRDKLKWFPITAGISMTFAGGAALINMASLGYIYKWYTMVDPLALTGGIIIVVFFINKYREDNGVTISNLLSKSDKKLSILIGLITSTVFILILAAQFVALSKLLSPYFTSVNPLLLTIIPSTLIFSYVFWGGFTSVTKTDILQLVFVILFLITPIAYFILFKGQFLDNGINSTHIFEKMPLNLIILLSISLLFIPMSQDINIRVKSATSKNQAIIGLLIGACLYFLIVLASSYTGISLGTSGVTLDDPEQALSIFFKTHFPAFGVMAIIAALAAIISTLDSYSLNAITSVSQDLLAPIGIFKSQSHRKLINMAGLLVFVFSLFIALFFNQVLTLILTALLIYVSTLIPIAIAKRLSVNDNFIFLSSTLLIMGIIFVEIFKIEISLQAIIYPSVGIALMFVFYLIEKLIKR